MSEHVVTATKLNVRSAAFVAPGNVLVALDHGTRVEVLSDTNPAWWKVSAKLGARVVTGFCAARHLKPAANEPRAEVAGGVRAVDMPPNAGARRDSALFRHCPLGETNLPATPKPDGAAGERIAALHGIVDYLNVERSRRYLPTESSTFCNIYAYDFCRAGGAYLPRVWWGQKALLRLVRGETVGINYGKSIYELNANSLYDWLSEWGDDFGWTEAATLTELQDRVNEGRVGVICARRRDTSRSGHITCVVPESGSLSATRAEGRVVQPLQSQAGARNKRYFQNTWWNSEEYSGVGFWYAATTRVDVAKLP